MNEHTIKIEFPLKNSINRWKESVKNQGGENKK